MSEPLHEELDRLGIPFRSTRGELIEQFGSSEDDKFDCALPMTADFVATQTAPLYFRANRKKDTDRPMGVLRGEASDVAAVVVDLTERFGPPLNYEAQDDPTPVHWKLGTASEIVVTPGNDGCVLRIAPNYMPALTDRERLAVAGFRSLFEHAGVAFGLTELDGQNWLMHRQATSIVRLVDPADISQVEITEYAEARAHAFSTIGFRTSDGTYQALAESRPERFSKIATELADALGVEARTVHTKSS